MLAGPASYPDEASYHVCTLLPPPTSISVSPMIAPSGALCVTIRHYPSTWHSLFVLFSTQPTPQCHKSNSGSSYSINATESISVISHNSPHLLSSHNQRNKQTTKQKLEEKFQKVSHLYSFPSFSVSLLIHHQVYYSYRLLLTKFTFLGISYHYWGVNFHYI